MDLKGHTITGNIINNNSNLIIKSTTEQAIINGSLTNTSGNLNLNNLQINSDTTGVEISSGTISIDNVEINSSISLNIIGSNVSKITLSNNTFNGKILFNSRNSNSILNILSGTYHPTTGHAINTNGTKGTINISGGDITSNSAGVFVASNTSINLNISGTANITSTTSWAAVFIQNSNTPKNIKISGGTLSSKNTVIEDRSNSNFEITGGTISGTNYGIYFDSSNGGTAYIDMDNINFTGVWCKVHSGSTSTKQVTIKGNYVTC